MVSYVINNIKIIRDLGFCSSFIVKENMIETKDKNDNILLLPVEQEWIEMFREFLSRITDWGSDYMMTYDYEYYISKLTYVSDCI